MKLFETKSRATVKFERKRLSEELAFAAQFIDTVSLAEFLFEGAKAVSVLALELLVLFIHTLALFPCVFELDILLLVDLFIH